MADEKKPEPIKEEPIKPEPVKRAEGERPDETIPGGRYKVGDQIVNANGEPIKE